MTPTITLSRNTPVNAVAPTKFVVHSNEERVRSYPVLLFLIASIVGILWYVDASIEKEPLWILGGLAVGLALVETAPVKRRVDRCVVIGPLGIQRITITNNRSKYHPLLPRASVRDCLLTEHVRVFEVSTHLVFRVESTLVPVFPDVTLSFERCQSLLKQIQRALKES